MRRRFAIGLSALVVAAVPAIAVGNAIWVLFQPWLVDAQYALPGFPDDPHGLAGEERAELAKTGVRAVRPVGEGVEPLREARLPGGERAFGRAEVRHMADVRDLVTAFTAAWAVGLAVAVAAGVALSRLAGPGAVRHALARGGLVTLGAIAVAGLFALVAFDAFFTAFHGVFFEGDSWRFADTATLRRLYPDAFWAIASAAMVALVVVQAGAAIALARAAPRSLHRRPRTVHS